jgi:hypothetical protein
MDQRSRGIRAVIWLALALAVLPTACASSRLPPADAGARVADAAETAEVRVGPYRLRLPQSDLRYGIVPAPGNRFEMFLRWPGLSPVRPEPAPSDPARASMLAVEVVHLDGVPPEHLLSFWLRESPLRADPDPLSDDVPRTRGKPVHGLQTYVPGAGLRSVADDRFVGPAQAGAVPTYIECRPGSGEAAALATCDHHFLLAGTTLAVYVRYARKQLPHWRTIESGLSAKLRQAMAAR